MKGGGEGSCVGWIGSEHNICVFLDILWCHPVVSSNWTELTVLTGAQVEKGWGRCAPQGRWGQKADVGNPGGRHGR